MWTGKAFIASIVLLFSLVSSMTFVGAEAQFSVSPGQFTVHDAPPLGEPYTIPEKIIVWNRDNVERLIFVSSEIPPENAVTPGYEPIPNENWVRPIPSSFLIEENSFALIQLSFNIPRWENLTGKKWEVWIGVERQPLPGEIGVLRPTVRVDIETAGELPPVRKGVSYYLALLLSVILVFAAVVVVAWILTRAKGRKTRQVLLRVQLHCDKMFSRFNRLIIKNPEN
jgi:hypothetical protein